MAAPQPPPKVVASEPKPPPELPRKEEEVRPVDLPKTSQPENKSSDPPKEALEADETPLFQQAHSYLLVAAHREASEVLQQLVAKYPDSPLATQSRLLLVLIQQLNEQHAKLQAQEEKIAALEKQIKRLVEVDLKRAKKRQ